jgi:hypothetical protein
MFTDAYHTTPCAPYQMDRVKKEIKISVGLGEDNPFRLAEFGKGEIVMALTGPDKDIQPFAHPLIMHGRDFGFFDDTVVFDARGFVRVGLDGSVTISQPDEFAMHVLRARLTRYVEANHYANLEAVGTFPLQVFVNWLGQILTRRLSLDPQAQHQTMAIIAIYYISLFKEPNELTNLSDSSIAKTAQLINRLFRIDAELVVNLLRTMPPITNVTNLVVALKEHGGSIRFENLSVALLYTIIGGSWFGSQAKEVLAVALEHPPTWISIVATALTSRGYRNTPIAEQVERVNKQDAGNDYLRGLYKLPGLTKSQS